MRGNLTAISVVCLPLVLSGCGVVTSHSSSSVSGGASSVTSGKAPPIGASSTAKGIASYVAYYQGHGYTITKNQQTFNADGTVKTFQFAATRSQGANKASVSASIDAATNTVSTSEDSDTNAHL